MGKVTRPVLRYYGGGWTRRRWTQGFFPKAHNTFVDACCGPATMTVTKDPVQLEIINDADNRVVNFMQQARDDIKRLVELINLTPWAEVELERCLEVSPDPLEDARRFFMVCWATVHGGPTGGSGSFRYQLSVEGRYTPPAHDAINRTDLYTFATRLKRVHILNKDAIWVIKKYKNNPSALIYFDPPYLPETRKRKYGYNHEPSPAWHRLAAYWLRQAKGFVVVAGYQSRLYERIYEAYGWQRVEREQKTNGKSTAVECLWLSPNTQRQLTFEATPLLKAKPLPIFAGAAQ